MNVYAVLRRAFLHIVLVCVAMHAGLQVNSQPVVSKTFLLHDGNQQSKINCINQASNGFLLVGSKTGLFLFNGLQFEKVKTDTSLSSVEVTAIHELRPGKTWIGFRNGSLAIFQNHQLTPLQFEEGVFRKAITKIITDSIGNVWCSTAGEGVYVFNGRHWINFNADDGMTDNYVYDICLAGKSSVVCGTDNGINYLQFNGGKKQVRHAAADSSIDKIIRRIVPASKGKFIAGTQSAFAGSFSLPALVTNNLLYGKKQMQVNGLAITGTYTWIATEEDGVWYYDVSLRACNFGFNKLNLPLSKAEGLFADAAQNVWVFSGNQLIKTSGSKLLRLPTNDTLHKNLHSLLAYDGADNAKSIWYDYNGGIKEYTCTVSGTGLLHAIPSLQNKAEITSLYDDGYGRIWIATMGSGLWQLEIASQKITQVVNDYLPPNANILSINGKGQTIWVTGLEGIVKASLNAGEISYSPFSNTEQLGTNYVYSVFTDSRNRTWFATDGKGVAKLEDNKFTSYNNSKGLQAKVIYGIAEDRKNRIWMNTLNDGLYFFDGNNFHHLTVKDGLTDNNISTIAAAKNGNIIALSKNAIDIIDAGTFAIETIGEEQGIGEINADLHSASLSKDGRLYFSTSTGLYSLSTMQHANWPKAFIDHAELFLNDFNIDSVKEFSYDENNLGINFNAIDFDHPEQIQFSYLLEGFGNTWIVTRDKYVNFPKLPPGQYTFRVKASLSSNFHFSPEASYRFVIHKPYWQRWWFVVLATLIFIAGFWIIIYNREKQQQRWQQLHQENLQSQLDTLKTQISPHFFFNSLNTLIALIEESPKTAVNYTTHLSDFFRKMLQHRFRDIISLEEELEMIADYAHIQKHRFEGSLQVEVVVSDAVAKHKNVAPLSLQLLVENAIKHNAFTEADPLLIKIYTEGNYLVVHNNKKQKLQPEPGAGIGLQNITHRYKLLTGNDIIIDNSNHHFTVKLPLI